MPPHPRSDNDEDGGASLSEIMANGKPLFSGQPLCPQITGGAPEHNSIIMPFLGWAADSLG